VELLSIDAPQGAQELRAQPIAAPVRIRAGRLAFGAHRTGGEQELTLEIDVEAALPGRLAPRVRFYNATGNVIRDIRAGVDIAAGTRTARVPLVVRKMERFGSITCIVNARVVVREDRGVLRLVKSEAELLGFTGV
jgi:hypothetical protein